MAQTLFTDLVTLIQSSWLNDADAVTYNVLSAVGGTANAITATGPTTVTSYAAKQRWFLTPAALNTGATAINISSIGSRNIFHMGSACIGGELRVGVPVLFVDDGTQLNIVGNMGPLLLTQQASTSGTSIDFTGIPAWVKKITVQFVGVSTNGTDSLIVQIGDSGGIEVNGYLSASSELTNAAGVVVTSYTNGYGVAIGSAASVLHGSMMISMENSAAFTWVESGVLNRSDTASIYSTAGSKSTSAALDRVRITTTGGTQTFDAGAINLLLE